MVQRLVLQQRGIATGFATSLARSSNTRPARRTATIYPIYALSRPFHSTIPSHHKTLAKPAPGEGLKVTYITPENDSITVLAREGDNLLDLAHAHDIDLEGACEGSLACSTCHVIVDEKHYDMLEEPSDEENDMLDLAFGLTETSRLGCQVVMTKDLDGITVRLPSMTRNLQNDKMR
ncbi:2Fe-2S ferredoxin-type domain-containing protein [Phlyctochytrium arcticum]|nr:2Fe-2S ferredoxin-type domain-containing protein [Phlyctochytrium arcticum]